MSRRPSAGRLALALLASLAGAASWSCERKNTAPTPPADKAAETAPGSASAGAAPADASPSETSETSESSGSTASDAATSATSGATKAPSWAFDCADTSAPKAGKSIGHTSVVFKIELASGKKAAWKPNAKKVKGRYKGEIAAYRLAGALGLVNVPPACFRPFDAAAAAAALAANADAARLFADEAIVEDGKVHGVVIPWIDGLSFWPLEKEPLRTEARTWLTAGSEIPADKLDLARQTSTLVAFDFISGNWDRYSGENVGIDRTGAFVLYIDNDAGFMQAPPKDRVARNKVLLDATDRFSRRLVTRLRDLDEQRLAAAFGEETAGKPLLSKTVVSIIAARVKELLAVIDAKITKRGEAETLYFP